MMAFLFHPPASHLLAALPPHPQKSQLSHLLNQRREIQATNSRARAENENRQQRIEATATKLEEVKEKTKEYEADMRMIEASIQQGKARGGGGEERGS